MALALSAQSCNRPRQVHAISLRGLPRSGLVTSFPADGFLPTSFQRWALPHELAPKSSREQGHRGRISGSFLGADKHPGSLTCPSFIGMKHDEDRHRHPGRRKEREDHEPGWERGGWMERGPGQRYELNDREADSRECSGR